MIGNPQIQVFVYSIFVEDSLYTRTVLIAGGVFAIYPSVCLSIYLIAVVNKID